MNIGVNDTDIELDAERIWTSGKTYTSIFSKYRIGGLFSPTGPHQDPFRISLMFDPSLKRVLFKIVNQAKDCIVDRALIRGSRFLRFLSRKRELINEVPAELESEFLIDQSSGARSASVLVRNVEFYRNGLEPVYVQVIEPQGEVLLDSFHALWLESVFNRIPDADVIGSIQGFESAGDQLVSELREDWTAGGELDGICA